nr:hypothetical protein [Tanacetum cinerariifolium]
MADVNVNAPADQAPTMAPPTRTDDQILPHIRWCQLDEQWVDLTKDSLRDALQITPVNNNNAFSSPPTPDAPINFFNNIGYLKVIRNLSNVVTNDMFQPAITSSTRDQILHFIFLMKNLFLDILSLVLSEPNEKSLGCLFPINVSLPTFKPAKATKMSNLSVPKADLWPPVTKLASSQQPKPKPAPAKSQGKKHKLVTKTSDKMALEEGLKSVYDAPHGSLPPVVIREPDSGKYQLLLEVQGKGKEKVSDEQVALDLLTLQTPKKKSHADQFIFQRRTSTPTESSGHNESSSLYAEIRLTDIEVESDEDVPAIDVSVQDEGQDGPHPGEQDEGHAGPNPSDVVASQAQSSLVVHAGRNLQHTDPEENLKLTVEEHVILEEPASSTGTLSSLQHLTKDLSFSDLFFNDKPSEADNEKTTAETEAESMVSVIIQQDTSAIPPMTTPILDLTSRPDSPNIHRPLQAT